MLPPAGELDPIVETADDYTKIQRPQVLRSGPNSLDFVKVKDAIQEIEAQLWQQRSDSIVVNADPVESATPEQRSLRADAQQLAESDFASRSIVEGYELQAVAASH